MTITTERTQTQEPARTANPLARLEAFWRAHPAASALTSFTLAVIFAGLVVMAYVGRDLLVVGLGYVAMVAAGIFGALEAHRSTVSAGQGCAL